MMRRRPEEEAAKSPTEVADRSGSSGQIRATGEFELPTGNPMRETTAVRDYINNLIAQAPSLSETQRALIRDGLGHSGRSTSLTRATESPPSMDRIDDAQDRQGAA